MSAQNACFDDPEPGPFGIQVGVEWLVRDQLRRQVLSALDLFDWFTDLGSRHDRSFQEAWQDLSVEVLRRVRPGFLDQIHNMANAVAQWITVERPEWLQDDEHGDLDDPFDRLPSGAVEYLVQLLVLGITGSEPDIEALRSDRLWAHKVAGGL